MRLNHWLFAAFLYLAFMGIGIILGSSISSYAHGRINNTPYPTIHELASKKPKEKNSYPIPILPEVTSAQENKLPADSELQTNFLLILVDDLSLDNPNLKSVWIWIIQTDQDHWTFLPLFDPQLNPAVVDSFSDELNRTFELNENHQLNEKFLALLNSHAILWHHYLVTDQIFLNQLSAFYQLTNPTLNQLMNKICQNITNKSLPLSNFEELVKYHSYSDGNSSLYFQKDILTSPIPSLTCDFPTLTH